VQAELIGKAQVFSEQLHRELQSLDQALRMLEYAWEQDPTHFDLSAWSRQAVALNDVSLSIFIAGADGVIRSSTRTAAVGTNVSGRDYFRHAAELPTDDNQMFVGALVQGQLSGLWQINLVRRLDNPDGSFGGIIATSYDAQAFARFYRDIEFGPQDAIGVMSIPDGAAWTVTGATQVPAVVNIAGTPLFATTQAAREGIWQGPSGLDATGRIYAFTTVPDQPLKVIIGTDRAEAMRPVMAWERDALIFAGGITLLVLLMSALLIREEGAGRRRDEAQARERAILEAALAGMSDGIMMVDRDLRLIAWNHRFPAATGVSPETLRIGLPMEEILRAQAIAGEFGPVDVEPEVARRMELIRTGVAMGTIERSRPGGRHLEIRRNPLPGGGFVTLYTDVTERHQAEERLRASQTMAAIGRLTAGIAHDFNNLLISISGNAEMLHRQLGSDPTHARRLAVILQSAERGGDLVRRLLAFARKQALAPALVDLNRTVHGMSDLLRATLGRTIRVETKLDEQLWPALIDPLQIEHVILNLAINARDAMPDGGTLIISTANTTLGADNPMDLPAGDYVAVAVSDTGSGMSAEVMRNAFEPFFTTKPPGRGSGLGLSQAYGVASQSGGGVKIDSTIGVGTMVTMLLPRAMEDVARESGTGGGRDPAEAGSGPQRQPAEVVGDHTVLVVDDEAECRETVGAMLESNGFAVSVAASGDEALRLIEGGLQFDLLLVDFVMPDMNGAELARHVRARRPSVPVVFFTGGSNTADVRGERWVLMKPFLMQTLVDTVRSALGQARSED
jgi:signal transduction histidine kinase